jgi:methyl-accepting chemotaxis protein
VIHDIAKSIGAVSEISASIAAAVEEQNAATADIARSVQEAAAGARVVTTSVSEVSGTIGQSGRLVVEMENAVSMLGQSTQTLTQEIANFLGAVRTA